MRNHGRRAALLACALAIAIGCAGSRPAPAPSPAPAAADPPAPAAVTEAQPPPRSEPRSIEGVVLDASGEPVAGAVVAVSDPTLGAVLATAQSGADGRFSLAEAPAGRALSAHHPDHTGVFVEPAELNSGGGALQLTLGKRGTGVTVRGRVSIATALPAGLLLEIARFSDSLGDVWAVPVAADGSFSVELPAGTRFLVRVVGGQPVGQSLFSVTDGVAEGVVELFELGPPPDEVVAWLSKHGVPLATAEPGGGIDDLKPLAKTIGKARIVGLGEATHGTREFFQLKHRFLEYLVTKHGFTIFAIEANQPECRVINDYVLHGKGDARTALAGIYFWTWNTEEVLALIEWMRAWNADPKHKRKLQFMGFDMQVGGVAHANVAAYLRRVAPDRAEALLEPIAPLAEDRGPSSYAAATAEVKQRARDGLAAIINAFDADRKAWIKASSKQEWADLRHDVRILEQVAGLADAEATGRAPDARDEAMAENVDWILEQAPKGTRIVLWAHNGHLSRKLDGWANMGSHLAARHGSAYLVFGFVFAQGSFQAIDYSGTGGGLREFTLGPPRETDAAVAFSRTGHPLLVADLRAAAGAVAAWFAAPHHRRDTGAVFSSEENMTVLSRLSREFDAVIFVETTTRARPLQR